MHDKVKVALIIAATLIICEGIWIFFSPFQNCMRQAEDAIACIAIGVGKQGPQE